MLRPVADCAHVIDVIVRHAFAAEVFLADGKAFAGGLGNDAAEASQGLGHDSLRGQRFSIFEIYSS